MTYYITVLSCVQYICITDNGTSVVQCITINNILLGSMGNIRHSRILKHAWRDILDLTSYVTVSTGVYMSGAKYKFTVLILVLIYEERL